MTVETLIVPQRLQVITTNGDRPHGVYLEDVVSRERGLEAGRLAIDETGSNEDGVVLIRLNVDGEDSDKVLVDRTGDHDVLEVVMAARGALDTIYEALQRIRGAS